MHSLNSGGSHIHDNSPTRDEIRIKQMTHKSQKSSEFHQTPHSSFNHPQRNSNERHEEREMGSNRLYLPKVVEADTAMLRLQQSVNRASRTRFLGCFSLYLSMGNMTAQTKPNQANKTAIDDPKPRKGIRRESGGRAHRSAGRRG